MNTGQSLTIVMYHYVRPILNTEYPNIKGLELEKFYKQLDYFEENYSIVDTEDVINSILAFGKYFLVLVIFSKHALFIKGSLNPE